jgi:hypothetical protein
LAILRSSGVKILNVNLAEIKTGSILNVVKSKCGERDVDIVLGCFTIEFSLESEFPYILELTARSVCKTQAVIDTVGHISAAIKSTLGNNFHQVGEVVPGGGR